jgi:ubiquinol-cytochrome c reductase cytochrome b subunit
MFTVALGIKVPVFPFHLWLPEVHWYKLKLMGLFLYREILCYPTPINFNYWYGIGLLLVFLLVNQVLTGIQVGSYYIVSIDVALSSVDYLMREITYGWSFRYLHSNGAY